MVIMDEECINWLLQTAVPCSKIVAKESFDGQATVSRVCASVPDLISDLYTERQLKEDAYLMIDQMRKPYLAGLSVINRAELELPPDSLGGECGMKECIPNTKCPVCGASFYAKPSHLQRYRTVCCSMACAKKWRRWRMTGKGNHQYGLKGNKNASFKGAKTLRRNGKQWDVWIYCPEHPYADKHGRVKDYRLVVEANADLFPAEHFDIIGGKRYLRPNLFVHHKDQNHENNNLENLQIVTRAEHRAIHNLLNPQQRDRANGKFIPTKEDQ